MTSQSHGEVRLLMRLFVLLSCCVLHGCASYVSGLPLLPANSDAAYQLGPGDSLQIAVFGEPELSGTYRVSDSGVIAMPLVGLVPVSGLNVEQLQRRLVEHLQTSAIRAPNVTVAINEYRPFFILGEVQRPGSYPYVPNMSVLTAVAIAGGFTYRAAEGQISVTRNINSRATEARAARDTRVLPGDVIYVFERHL